MSCLRRLGLLTLLLAAALVPAGPAAAFRLVPIEMEFAPAGREATQTFSASNDSAVPVAVEVTIKARAMNESGQDVLQDAFDDWVVFPEQLILQPGETQTIRVQWIGDAAPPRELPFRLVAEQVPVDIGRPPAQGGQVRLLVTYVASLYVVPEGARPDVKIVSAGPVTAPNGQAALEVVARNDGTRHRILKDASLGIAAGGKTLTLPAEALEGFAGENILAGATRRFLLPWPAGLPVGPVTVDLSLPTS